MKRTRGKKNKPAKTPAVTPYEQLWSAFKACAAPGPKQLERLLEGLLALPPDPTPWGAVFNLFCTHGHPDLVAIYRKIADGVPDTAAGGKSWFYWFAMRCFERERPDMMADIAADFALLNQEDAYEAEVLQDLLDYLLAAHRDREALELAEHFLPGVRRDIQRGAVAQDLELSIAELIFQLRVGEAIRSPAKNTGASREKLAKALRRHLEEVIDEALAQRAAVLSTAGVLGKQWMEEDFRLLHEGESHETISKLRLRQQESLMGLAWETWHQEGLLPGSTYSGLQLLLKTAEKFKHEHARSDHHLIHCLNTQGLEERLSCGAPGLLGTNGPKAALLLEMHEVLLRFAQRKSFMILGNQEDIVHELARLRVELQIPKRAFVAPDA